MDEREVEAIAQIIWEASHKGGVWTARMSWYRATPEVREKSIKERGTHPDCFTDNRDVEQAFAAAKAILARTLRSVEPAPQTAFDDLLAVNEHTSNMWHEMRRVLLMALNLAHSGNHDGTSENCPTCHIVKEARKIGIVFDSETREPLG